MENEEKKEMPAKEKAPAPAKKAKADPASAPKQPATPQTLLSFDRYFATLGKPVHHKAGMKAFLKKGEGQGKKTQAYWELIFKNY